MVLFEDETGFSLHPKLGRIWAKRGSRPFVYTQSQHQKRLNIFGWVDLIHGSHGIAKWISGNTDGFIQVLRKERFLEFCPFFQIHNELLSSEIGLA